MTQYSKWQKLVVKYLVPLNLIKSTKDLTLPDSKSLRFKIKMSCFNSKFAFVVTKQQERPLWRIYLRLAVQGQKWQRLIRRTPTLNSKLRSIAAPPSFFSVAQSTIMTASKMPANGSKRSEKRRISTSPSIQTMSTLSLRMVHSERIEELLWLYWCQQRLT